MTSQKRRLAADGGEDADGERYEVVISHPDGFDKEHAELHRKKLIAEGYHEHVVAVRPHQEEQP